MKKTIDWSLRLALCLLVMAGCQSEQVVYQPLSEQDALLFSDTLLTAFRDPAPELLDKFQDPELLLQRIRRGPELSAKEKEFCDLYASTWVLSESFFNYELGLFWEYAHLNRIRFQGEDCWVQLRVHKAPQGFTYLDFFLKKRKGNAGAVSVGDYYDLVMGEWLSDGTRRYAALLEYLDQFSEEKRESWLIALNDCSLFYESGEFAEAEKVYRSLTPELQALKTIQNSRLNGAAEQSPQVYEKVKSEFRKHFPEDTDPLLTDLSFFLVQENYPAARQSVDQLREFLGGNDAWLECQLGNAFQMEGAVDSAYAHYHRAYEMEPEFDLAVYARFFALVELGRYQEAVAMLDELDDLGFGLAELGLERYPEFLNSEALSEWIEASSVAGMPEQQL